MPTDEGTWTVQRLLEWTTPYFTRKDVDSPRLSAELLLAHVLQLPRIKLYTGYQNSVTDSQLKAFRQLVQRAAEQEPIAYLIGHAHFFNLEFQINRDVLIPRPDTETLVENVLQLVRFQAGLESPRVLDLCTGSGCIAAAVARHIKGANVVATDISSAAIDVARANLHRLELADRVTLFQGDLYDALRDRVDRQPFHLILSNPPYIASDKIPKLDPSVKNFEPLSALDGGPDGLQFHRRILSGAPDHLLPGGHVFLEIAFDQGEPARALLANFPQLTEPRILQDHARHDRVLTAKKI